MKKKPKNRLPNLRTTGTSALLGLSILGAASLQAQVLKKITPTEYKSGMRNPLMGYKEGTEAKAINEDSKEHWLQYLHRQRSEKLLEIDELPYSLLVRDYIPFSLFDTDGTGNVEDIVLRIKNYSDVAYRGYPEKNIKVIPRVILTYSENRDYWPQGMAANDWKSKKIQDRVRLVVQAMGKAWDEDPRIAWIQMGMVGKWGEQEGFERPDSEKFGLDTPLDVSSNGKQYSWIQILGSEFEKAFTKKMVAVRSPHKWDPDKWGSKLPFRAGMYWDTMCADMKMNDPTQHDDGSYDEWPQLKINNLAPQFTYHTAPVEGEVIYKHSTGNFVEPKQMGNNPDETYSYKDGDEYVYTQFLVDTIKSSHITASGIGYGEIDKDKKIKYWDKNKDSISKTQAAFGYRFVINDFEYTEQILSDRKLEIRATVTNAGSAPTYAKGWPLHVVIMDNDKNIVWTSPVVTDSSGKPVDITKWLPGTNYDWVYKIGDEGSGDRVYDSPAPVNKIGGVFKLPDKTILKDGQYTLGLSIFDPTTGKPGIYFSVPNFFAESNTQPLARIRIETEEQLDSTPIPTISKDHDWRKDDDRYYVGPTVTIPEQLTNWRETFSKDSSIDEYSTIDNGLTSWSVTPDNGNFRVKGEKMAFNDTSKDEGVFTSGKITLVGPVKVSLKTQSSGTVSDADETPSDYLRFYYRVNGGPLQMIKERIGKQTAVETWTAMNINAQSGDSLELIVKAKVNYYDEYYYFDDLIVENTNAASIPLVKIETTEVKEGLQTNGVLKFARATNVNINKELKVKFSVDSSSTATNPDDYSGLDSNGTVTIPANILSVEKTVSIQNDSTIESDEKLVVNLIDDSIDYDLGSPKQATMWIKNDDTSTTPPSLVTVEAKQNGAEKGLINGEFTFTRSNGDISKSLDVTFSVNGSSSAENAKDYETLDGKITIPAGSLTAIKTVIVKDDSIFEPDEAVIVDLIDGSDYDLGLSKQAIIIITSDDPSTTPPSLVTVEVKQNGAEKPLTNGEFTFTRSNGDISKSLDVTFSVNGKSTAENAKDYETLDGKITIPAGSLTAIKPVIVKDDSIFEPDETVVVDLIDGSDYDLGLSKQAKIIITSDDPSTTPQPLVTVSSAGDSNATESTGSGTFTFTRSNPSTSNEDLVVRFSIDTSVPNAASSFDYNSNSIGDRVTIRAGQDKAKVSLIPTADNIVEPDEVVVLKLATDSAYTLNTTNSATVTIKNGPPPTTTTKPKVTVSASPLNTTESSTVTFTFDRGVVSNTPLVVDFNMSGTATSSAGDYDAPVTKVTIPAGSRSKSIDLTIKEDGVTELEETVVMNVSPNATLYELGTPNSVTVKISANNGGEALTWLVNFDGPNPNATWSATSGVSVVTPTEYSSFFPTNSLRFNRVGSEGVFTSGLIRNISGTPVKISLDVKGSSTLDAAADARQDYLKAYIKVNGGAEQSISEIYGRSTLPNTITTDRTGVTTLEVIIRSKVTAGDEFYLVDNLSVSNVLTIPWLTENIGAVAATGNASVSNLIWTIIGSGQGVQGVADEFRYVHQEANDDCLIEVDVTSLTNTNPSAKAGVMIRENTNANAMFAMVSVTPGSDGVIFQYRTSTNNGAQSILFKELTGVPRSLQLKRTLNTFEASYKDANENWIKLATQSITMARNTRIGMAVTSHNDGALSTGVMNKVNVTK